MCIVATRFCVHNGARHKVDGFIHIIWGRNDYVERGNCFFSETKWWMPWIPFKHDAQFDKRVPRAMFYSSLIDTTWWLLLPSLTWMSSPFDFCLVAGELMMLIHLPEAPAGVSRPDVASFQLDLNEWSILAGSRNKIGGYHWILSAPTKHFNILEPANNALRQAFRVQFECHRLWNRWVPKQKHFVCWFTTGF